MSQIAAIYVNGIENTIEQAQATATAVQAHTGIEVRLVYCSHSFWSGVVQPDRDDNYHTVIELKDALEDSYKRKLHLYLIAHSKGTQIVLRSLQIFSEVEVSKRNWLSTNVTISAYGGIAVLPKSLAFSVHNCLNKRDEYAKAGAHFTSLTAWILEELNTSRHPLRITYWKEVIKNGRPKPSAAANYQTNVIDPFGSSKLSDFITSRQHAFMTAYLPTLIRDATLWRQELIARTGLQLPPVNPSPLVTASSTPVPRILRVIVHRFAEGLARKMRERRAARAAQSAPSVPAPVDEPPPFWPRVLVGSATVLVGGLALWLVLGPATETPDQPAPRVWHRTPPLLA